MRKITLSLFALLVTIVAYCGAPQAFSYQAVALGPSGGPVKNKSIALRMSVLDGSATGTLVYQERQTATTDAAGLISIQIGNGAALSGTFPAIAWQKGLFFLKTEIDTNGGTSYNAVGTVQFYSVPYAMYADKTNLSSLDYPDGLGNITPVRLNGTTTYVVPSGQTLYITNITQNGSTSCTSYGAAINGVTLAMGASNVTGSTAQTSGSTANNKTNVEFPMTIPAGGAVSTTTCGTSVVGFTIPTGYSHVVFDLNSGNYTVPAGKIFVIKNIVPSQTAAWSGYYTVNGMTTAYNKTPTFADAGQTITSSGQSGSVLLMGYLKDK